MKKTAIAVLSAGALALAGALGVSYYVGSRIQQTFEATAQTWNAQDSFSVRVLEYRRGIISSHAVSLWSFAAQDNDYEVTVTHDIVHGPWPWGKLAQIRSKFHLPESTEPELKRVLEGRAPLEWQVTADWQGATDHHLSSPAFFVQFQDQSSLEWGGLQARWALSAQQDTAKGFMHMPLMRTRVEGTDQMEWEDAQLTFNTHIPTGHQFWQGPAQLKLKLLKVQEPETATAFRLQQWLVDSSIELQEEWVDMRLKSQIEHIEMAGYNARNLMLSMHMKQIHADWLDQALQWVQQSAEEETQGASMGESLPILLSGKPEIAIDNLSAETDDGPAQLSARVHYVGTQPEAFDPVTDIQAMLRASLPKSMLVQLLDTKVRSDYLRLLEQMGQELDEDMLLAAVEDGVGKRLQGLLRLGAVSESDTQYDAELVLKQGEFQLNGQPIELQYLLQLGEAM